MKKPNAGSDLLIVNVGQLLTFTGPEGPRSGPSMMELGLIKDAAVLLENGLIWLVGPSSDVAAEARGVEILDARGRLVMPGLVDAHTHAAFAGSRESELADKLQGKSYAQIARDGGGIQRTVKDTRTATDEVLREQSYGRFRRMTSAGTTTAEVKSGYGLNLEDELRLLRVIGDAGNDLPLNVVPTFLGAHAVPEEHRGSAGTYVEELLKTIIPAIASQGLARFCDVFVEKGFFSKDDGKAILEAGKAEGMKPKVHADELTSCGGAELAGEVGATTADHLLHSSARGLQAMKEAGTMAVLLPGTSFSTSGLPYCDARRVIELGIPVALGSDLSPNSWLESMQFVINLACHHLRMYPEEALCAATINAAWAIGLEKEVGSMEEGKRGDLLLLDVYDYREIPYRLASNLVNTVVKDGTVVVSRQ